MGLAQLPWARAWRLHHIGMFTIAAVAVGIFVYFGVREDSYQEQLRTTLGQAPEREERSPYHKVIMLVTTAVYLYLGFFHGLWHPGWIIFLLGVAVSHLADLLVPRR